MSDFPDFHFDFGMTKNPPKREDLDRIYDGYLMRAELDEYEDGEPAIVVRAWVEARETEHYMVYECMDDCHQTEKRVRKVRKHPYFQNTVRQALQDLHRRAERCNASLKHQIARNSGLKAAVQLALTSGLSK